jgi:hypothetical protein
MEVRSYVAEPDRGPRNWDGKQAEKQAVHGNRRRVQGQRGKRLQRQRGERIERNFAHQFDTGGLDRLYVRGLENVHKKFLIQAAACIHTPVTIERCGGLLRHRPITRGGI